MSEAGYGTKEYNFKNKEEVFCNYCGLTCNLYEDSIENGGLIFATYSGGFNSTPGNGVGAINDLDQHKFSICEFCLDYIIKDFKIKPEVLSYHISQHQEFIPANEMALACKPYISINCYDTYAHWFKLYRERNLARNNHKDKRPILNSFSQLPKLYKDSIKKCLHNYNNIDEYTTSVYDDFCFSDCFIEKHCEDEGFCWECTLYEQRVSIFILNKYKEKFGSSFMKWKYIALYQRLSNKFISENLQNLNLFHLKQNIHIDQSFIEKIELIK